MAEIIKALGIVAAIWACFGAFVWLVWRALDRWLAGWIGDWLDQ